MAFTNQLEQLDIYLKPKDTFYLKKIKLGIIFPKQITDNKLAKEIKILDNYIYPDKEKYREIENIIKKYKIKLQLNLLKYI